MRNLIATADDERFDALAAAARRAGIKLTHQRLEVFRAVAESSSHPNAESVFRAVQARVPTVSLDTVYRTLWLLNDLGLVRTLGPQRSGVRFDANVGQHHHHVCLRCGRVQDFESNGLNRLEIPTSVEMLGTVEAVQVEVRGLCADCRAAESTTT